MSDSILQVNQIKDKGGNAVGITVADTTANVTIKGPTLQTATNKYSALKTGELNSLGYLNRNFFGASYYLSSAASVSNSSDTALTSGNSNTWTKQPSSGSSGSDDSDIFGRFSGGQFTGGVSGYYLVVFNLSMNNIPDTGRVEISVRINNDANKKIAIQTSFISDTTATARCSCSGVAALDTDDVLTPYVLQLAGTNKTPVADQRTNISFYYLGTSDL